MYKIYLKHKNENYYSLVVNGKFHKYCRWLREHSQKYRLDRTFGSKLCSANRYYSE